MFKEDKDGIKYVSDKYEYSLLEGKTSNGYTSDIVFIFREPTEEDIKNDYYGEVVNWVYGGFEDLDFVEARIKEYEERKVNNDI